MSPPTFLGKTFNPGPMLKPGNPALKKRYHPERISDEDLTRLGQMFDCLPSKVSTEANGQRYTHLPATLMDREPQYLEHEEVVQLMKWKLSNGTFRPGLLQRVESNPAKTVRKVTEEAFAIMAEPLSTILSYPDQHPKELKAAITKLSELNGVGPATASLLLAVAYPLQVPFFSDELAAWTHWDASKGGWKPKLKYDWKEYLALCETVGKLRQKTRLPAGDVEKAAWSLRRVGMKDLEDIDMFGNEPDEIPEDYDPNPVAESESEGPVAFVLDPKTGPIPLDDLRSDENLRAGRGKIEKNELPPIEKPALKRGAKKAGQSEHKKTEPPAAEKPEAKRGAKRTAETQPEVGLAANRPRRKTAKN